MPRQESGCPSNNYYHLISALEVRYHVLLTLEQIYAQATVFYLGACGTYCKFP
jgi:hypothetical protein